MQKYKRHIPAFPTIDCPANPPPRTHVPIANKPHRDTLNRIHSTAPHYTKACTTGQWEASPECGIAGQSRAEHLGPARVAMAMASGRSSPAGAIDTKTAEEMAAARENEIRRAFVAIQGDPLLTAQEKGQRMQELMISRSASVRREARSMPGSPVQPQGAGVAEGMQPNSGHSRASSVSEAPESCAREPDEAERAASHHPSGALGCKHYRSGVRLQAPCCGGWFVCRFCHDEAADHGLERFRVRRMLCMACGATGDAAQDCAACGVRLAAHYCSRCALWDDEPGRAIFHCDQCGICRRGRREDYVHCAKCVGCVDAAHSAEHKCLEDSLRSACPICSEDLFATTTPVIFMPCGHAIHYLCHQEHTRSSYQCPICLKSIADVRSLFRRIDEMMAEQRMPDEYARVRSHILCNDCERRSVAPFHFVYHCCAHCRSYNTKLLRTFTEDAPGSTAALADGAGDTTPNLSAVVLGMTSDIGTETTLPASPASSATGETTSNLWNLSLNNP